jgi:hypothetical protein
MAKHLTKKSISKQQVQFVLGLLPAIINPKTGKESRREF